MGRRTKEGTKDATPQGDHGRSGSENDLEGSGRSKDDGELGEENFFHYTLGIQWYRTSGSVQVEPPGTYITVPPNTVLEKVLGSLGIGIQIPAVTRRGANWRIGVTIIHSLRD